MEDIHSDAQLDYYDEANIADQPRLYTAYLFSLFYWILSNANNKLDKPRFLNVTALFKFLSIILLIDNINIYGAILICYSLGDLMIFYSESYSLYFFKIGHVLFLWEYIVDIMDYHKDTLFELLLGSVTFISFTTLFIYNKLNKDDVKYLVYIFTLHMYLLIPLYYLYFGSLLFVISDVLIGFNVDHVQWTTWPLYYASIIYFKQFRDN